MNRKNKIILIIFSLFITINAFAQNCNLKTTTIDEDRLAAKTNLPRVAKEIAEKWHDRGEKNIVDKFTPQLEENWIEVKANPFVAREIADQWYEFGKKETALKFDLFFLKHYGGYSEFRDAIVEKWASRGETSIVLGLQSSPYEVNNKFEDFLNRGNFAEAEEYANKILEYWTSQNDEEIRENLIEKVAFAAKIGSGYYYNSLRSKLTNTSRSVIEDLEEYSEFFENIGLSSDKNDASIVDYLVSRTYINPTLPDTLNVSKDQVLKMLEIDLYELAKKNDIIFSILHVIALHAKKDPYFKLDILDKQLKWGQGACFYNSKSTFIGRYPLMSKFFRKALIHEWTHLLMLILFNNSMASYPAGNENTQMAWDEAAAALWKKFELAPTELKNKHPWVRLSNGYEESLAVFQKLKTLYSPQSFVRELITHFIELIVSDAIEDPQAQELVQPLYDYWIQYINPAIDSYIKQNTKLDTFVSTWERENILDPFNHQEVENEFQNDLKTIQSEPSKTGPLTEKWFFRGKIDNAVEISKISAYNRMVKTPKMMRSDVCRIYFSEKWRVLGFFDIAEELDQLCEELAELD